MLGGRIAAAHSAAQHVLRAMLGGRIAAAHSVAQHVLRAAPRRGASLSSASVLVSEHDDGHTWLIELHRPAQRNAVNASTALYLADRLHKFEDSAKAKVAVVVNMPVLAHFSTPHHSQSQITTFSTRNHTPVWKAKKKPTIPLPRT
jgi:hypothetical protein